MNSTTIDNYDHKFTQLNMTNQLENGLNDELNKNNDQITDSTINITHHTIKVSQNIPKISNNLTDKQLINDQLDEQLDDQLNDQLNNTITDVEDKNNSPSDNLSHNNEIVMNNLNNEPITNDQQSTNELNSVQNSVNYPDNNSVNATNEINENKTANSPVRLEILKDPKYETTRMRDYMKKAVKATSQYNKLINQERKDERRICLDLQTYTLHYPLGLGSENRMLKRNLEMGKCNERGKYPISILPGHYKDNYRKYTSQELKYFPINTVIYGPVITDTDKLPPILTRIEEDSFSDSDSNSSTSTEHSCCCDEKSCKKLKLENFQNGDCNCLDEKDDSSASSDAEDDEQPPKLVNLSFHFQQRDNAVCDVCKKNSLIKGDGTNEKLIHCTDCVLSFHPTCLEMTPEMITEIQLYPWECSKCKR